jgi:hypothetical protein
MMNELRRKESGCDLIRDIIPEFAWRDCGRRAINVVSIAYVPADIQTRHLSNTSVTA